MYIIATYLPRLRPLITRLHATLSASLSFLLGRRYGSDDSLSSLTLGRQAPRINMKLTGQGDLTSLIVEEKKDVVSESV